MKIGKSLNFNLWTLGITLGFGVMPYLAHTDAIDCQLGPWRSAPGFACAVDRSASSAMIENHLVGACLEVRTNFSPLWNEHSAAKFIAGLKIETSFPYGLDQPQFSPLPYFKPKPYGRVVIPTWTEGQPSTFMDLVRVRTIDGRSLSQLLDDVLRDPSSLDLSPQLILVLADCL
jgi:hypothetical protein